MSLLRKQIREILDTYFKSIDEEIDGGGAGNKFQYAIGANHFPKYNDPIKEPIELSRDANKKYNLNTDDQDEDPGYISVNPVNPRF
jgi:hypothetical protein